MEREMGEAEAVSNVVAALVDAVKAFFDALEEKRYWYYEVEDDESAYMAASSAIGHAVDAITFFVVLLRVARNMLEKGDAAGARTLLQTLLEELETVNGGEDARSRG